MTKSWQSLLKRVSLVVVTSASTLQTQPWLTTMDLAISQEVPGFMEGHKGKIYFTIDNLANLLNDDWGKSYCMNFPQQILYDFDLNRPRSVHTAGSVLVELIPAMLIPSILMIQYGVSKLA